MSSFAPTSKGSGTADGSEFQKFDAADAEFFAGKFYFYVVCKFVNL